MNAAKLFRLTTVPTSLANLLKGQLRFMNQYYEVTAIADGKDRKSWEIVAEREGVKCRPVPMERDISILKDIRSLFVLYRLFRKERPYIVHANTPKASLLGMLAAFFSGIPHRIYTVTGLRFETEKGIKREILISMERITCLAATRVIPEGEGVKNTLIRHRITGKELKVVGNGNINGIDIHYFSPDRISHEEKTALKKQLGIKPDDTVFCFVGRIVKDKGINELIEVFDEINRLYTHTKLLLVGRIEKKLDPLLPKTEEKIHSHPDILHAGEQADVRPYLAISDIFVFPSYREGFPNVVMEAGAMELPCIVTDINGCNEIIRDGVNGLIILPKSKEQLNEKMAFLFKNKDFLNRLKQNAREMITYRYKQENVWNALLEEYNKLERQASHV
jgi:glycosyltransferase involved in cell wall biosynthesis